METIEMEKLKKIYIIKEEERNNLIKNILNEITFGKEEKLMYCNFIIGPSASGKSTLSNTLIQKDSNLVRIDGDFIRGKYPNYKEISRLYPTDVFDILKNEMIYIKNEIVSCLIRKGYAFNKEYSLDYIDYILSCTKEAYDLGYNINYFFLLTSPLEIHLRAVERFFKQLKNGSIPRIVASSRQENAVKQIQNLINRIDINLINGIKIVDTMGNIYSIKKTELKKGVSLDLLDKYYIKIINIEKAINRIRVLEEYMDFYKSSLNENLIKRINEHMTIIKTQVNEK